MGAEFLSRWYFLSITQPILTNPKASSKFSLSGDYGDRVCFWNAKSQRYALWNQLIAVCKSFFHSSPISWNRNPVFRKSLKQLGICASSCPNFTVNSTLLSSFGVQSRSTCESTVIIHLTHSRTTFQRHLNQFNSAPYRSGNTG